MNQSPMTTFSYSKNSSAGFTLLEILISLTIVLILLSVAVPSYQRYVTRAQAAEIVLFIDPFRLAHQELIQEFGRRSDGSLNIRFAQGPAGDAQYCQLTQGGKSACESPAVTFYPASDLIIPGTDLVMMAGSCFARCGDYKIAVSNRAKSTEGKTAGNRLLYEFAQIMEPNLERVSYGDCMLLNYGCTVSLYF
ncbi:MAG: prepilin-type N-terminal cleavage/methylation domain-containing protein [Pseudohongiellaceae bacterium]|jgi:prepilin-type N-terminal cleavage/methylation domain-containing protein